MRLGGRQGQEEQNIAGMLKSQSFTKQVKIIKILRFYTAQLNFVFRYQLVAVGTMNLRTLTFKVGMLIKESYLQSIHRSVHARSLQSWPTLCHPVNCSPSASFVNGNFQAGILQWVAIPFSSGSFQPKDQTHISCCSCIAGGSSTHEPLGKLIHR